MQTRYHDYSAPDSTAALNAALAALLRLHNVGGGVRSGRLTGFLATANAVPDDKIDLERDASGHSAAMTRSGMIVTEDADLDDAVTFSPTAGANPRIDIVVLHHTPREGLPNYPATFAAVAGVEAAQPVPDYSTITEFETPLAEVWIAGGGGAPVITAAEIKILPGALDALIARHEPSYSASDGSAGLGGAWARLGANLDQVTAMRHPEDDERSLLLVNAFYEPSTSFWDFQDGTRFAIMVEFFDSPAADPYILTVYHADPALVAAGLTADFWTRTWRLRTDGKVESGLEGIELSGIRLHVDPVTPATLAAASTFGSRPAQTDAGVIVIATTLTAAGNGINAYRSVDEGAFFGGAVAVEAGAVGVTPQKPELCRLGGERLLCAYYRVNAGTAEIACRRSDDAGATWVALGAVPIALPIPAGPHVIQNLGVGLDYDGSRVYAVYVTAFGGLFYIYEATSDDLGATWTNRGALYSGNAVQYPKFQTHPLMGSKFILYRDSVASILYWGYAGKTSWAGAWTVGVSVDAAYARVNQHTLYYLHHTRELYVIYNPSTPVYHDLYWRKTLPFEAGPPAFGTVRPLLLVAGVNDLGAPGLLVTLEGNIVVSYDIVAVTTQYFATGWAPFVHRGENR